MKSNFLNYLNKNFKLNNIDSNNKDVQRYCFKEIPQSFSDYYKNESEVKNVKWTPENYVVVMFTQNNDMKELKNNLKILNRSANKNNIYKIEKLPGWYYKFLKKFSNLTIFAGSINIGINSVESVSCAKPDCLNNKIMIGRYSGITPESCPIFADNIGRIFVYDASTFRNYPTTDNSEDIKIYKNQEVKLLSSWNNIQDFLINEIERLKLLFIKNPTIYPIKNCAPYKL